MPLKRNPLRLEKPVTQKDKVQFYSTMAWRALREEIRLRDHNECVRCRQNGKVTPADVVHHKKEVELYPELALRSDNLECLCHACHEKTHEKFPNHKEARENKEKLAEKFPEIW